MNGYSIYKKGFNATPHEDNECYTLVEYLELIGLRYSHIHHGANLSSVAQRSKAKRLGKKRGVPDYLIVLPNKLLFIEMKREKGGVTSVEQKEWIKALSAVQNVEAVVCKGFDEAKIVIDRNLV